MAALLDVISSVRDPSRLLRQPSRSLLFLRNPKAVVAGAAIIGLVLFVAVFAPILSPYSPTQVHPLDRLKDIGSPHHLLGADQQGRGVLSRLICGARS